MEKRGYGEDLRFLVYALIPQMANKSQIVMELGMKEISARQWFPLIMIERFDHEPSLNEIADKCGMAHQSAKQLLDKLVEKQYVSVRHDEKDKRCLRYSLTEKAREWGVENYERNQKYIQEIFSDFSQEELSQFLSMERKLLHKFDEIRSNPEYWLDKVK